MSTLLASFILLKSNATGKFLCYGKDKADGTTTTLSFSQDINLQQEGSAAGAAGDQLVAEPAAAAGGGPEDFHLIKFEVEEAKTAPGLVHIRTCYNNKYWVRKCLESNSITAEANEAEEDQSKPTCTLFKPVFVGEEEEDNYLFANKYGNGKPPQKIQLIHVSQFGQLYVGVENDNGSIRTEQLIAASSDNSLNPTYFTAYDVTSNIVIPGRFTLMGLDEYCRNAPVKCCKDNKVSIQWIKETEYKTRDTAIEDFGGFESVELSILLCNDELLKLNKEWRDEDHVTDFLSTSQHIHEINFPFVSDKQMSFNF